MGTVIFRLKSRYRRRICCVVLMALMEDFTFTRPLLMERIFTEPSQRSLDG